VKYNFGSDGALSMNGGVLGIDVSKYQTKIDWKAVTNSGISCVIIRCGYRGYSTGVLVQDPMFKTHIEGAQAAGLKVGVYFFSQAVNEKEAVEEASMAIALAKKYNITYPIFIDTEQVSGGRADKIDNATRTAVCKAFCETVKSAGYTPGVYACKSWYESKLSVSALGAYKIWLAQYATAPTYSGKYDMWQYTEKGKVSGVTGNVDMNISYLGL
ncbi:MAG: glycoside hydrolase family 25 protein, partial [Lachnospiraceae bacterium]|nr:glycoside hydrolase family 25 protein [Lachnospiraceae bacterium]